MTTTEGVMPQLYVPVAKEDEELHMSPQHQVTLQEITGLTLEALRHEYLDEFKTSGISSVLLPDAALGGAWRFDLLDSNCQYETPAGVVECRKFTYMGVRSGITAVALVAQVPPGSTNIRPALAADPSANGAVKGKPKRRRR